MCYAYSDSRIILHSADEGRKTEILLKNPKVCILVERGCEVVRGATACDYGMKYESVMIEGTARFLSGSKKTDALALLETHYTKKPAGTYHEEQVKNLIVIEVTINFMHQETVRVSLLNG